MPELSKWLGAKFWEFATDVSKFFRIQPEETVDGSLGQTQGPKAGTETSNQPDSTTKTQQPQIDQSKATRNRQQQQNNESLFGSNDSLSTRAKKCVDSMCNRPTFFVHALDKNQTSHQDTKSGTDTDTDTDTDNSYYYLSRAENKKMPEMEKIFDSDIWPKMLELMLVEKQKNTLENKHVMDYLEQYRDLNRPLKLNPATQRLIKLMDATKFNDQFNYAVDIDREYYEEHDKYRLTATAAAKFSLADQERAKLALNVDQGYYQKYYRDSQFQIISSINLRTYLLYKYNKEDIADSQDQFSAEIISRLRKLNTHFKLIAKYYNKSYILQKVIAKIKIDRSEEMILEQMLRGMHVYSDLTDQVWEELDKYKVDFQSKFSVPNINQNIDSLINLVDPATVQRIHQLSKAKTYGICKVSISAHLASRPNDATIGSVKFLIERVLEFSKGAAPDFYPEAKPTTIASLIDNITFTIPRNFQQSKNALLTSIKSQLEIAEEEAQFNLAGSSQIDLDSFVASTLTSDIAERKHSDDYRNMTNFCLNLLPGYISDASITVDNHILVSARTLKFGVAAAGIIAHEVSHRLQTDLKTKVKESIGLCHIERYVPDHLAPPSALSSKKRQIKGKKKSDRKRKSKRPSNPDPFLHHQIFGPALFNSGTDASDKDKDKDKVYFSEDLADHFAASVLRKMQYTEPHHNSFCLLIPKMIFNNNLTSPYTHYQSSKAHPLIPALDDKHSSDPLRVILMAEQLNLSTPLCKEFAAHEHRVNYYLSDRTKITTPSTEICLP